MQAAATMGQVMVIQFMVQYRRLRSLNLPNAWRYQRAPNVSFMPVKGAGTCFLNISELLNSVLVAVAGTVPAQHH